MRGKVEDLILYTADEGITPACAGKREAMRVRQIEKEDHPRVCGEK